MPFSTFIAAAGNAIYEKHCNCERTVLSLWELIILTNFKIVKNLTKLGIEELRKTLPVLSREEQQGYMGMYANDCVFRCMAHILGYGDSVEAAERLALDYFAGSFPSFSGIHGDALTHVYLSVRGAGIDSDKIWEYMQSMGRGCGEIMTIGDVSQIPEYRQRGHTSGFGTSHAVVCKKASKEDGFTIWDPQKGIEASFDHEVARAAGCEFPQ